jgi:two-component system nitrogen regulation response regulator NtrX
MASETILLVDDEKSILKALKDILADEGYQTVLAGSGEEALSVVKERPVDLVLLDIWLPGKDGVAVLREVKEVLPELPVIMMSGHATIETAVTSTKLGAYDFIEKPLSLEKTVLSVRHALDQQRLRRENVALRRKMEGSVEILGKSPSIRALKQQIARAAPSQGRVLITGENGTGKELIARNIHLLSPREGGPFVEVNCAAIPEELIESELFGHERGAFTGAVSRRQGKFELADGGTIFLDEIGDMTLKTQAKVLRVLEGQPFTRIGGSQPISVNTRVIAATNKNLEERIAGGLFREDLFYRLNVIPFSVPPLREREEDIPLLSSHYLQLFTLQTGQKNKKLSPAALARLSGYHWPGNIRELKNQMERVVIMVPGDTVEADDIPLPGSAAPSRSAAREESLTFREARLEFERSFLTRALERNQWNVTRTARELQLERSHLHKKIKFFDIYSGREEGERPSGSRK